ncbi:argininosuccinate lyase [Ruminiclostridium sufflavum DSM 19573]|uniref:Argininosuccinate lyase n=1 Tax=Ruminiclostridium sufflavum DSM 19573 TaxID=1121337 RepID=A0A318XTS3_9FIRM|nr:argininosuccinate lyase [Ruminiclostridium sufflavum]PYG89889.1 argininosuccinate lyase [Ruminiclostridium sufflavum DSM 19573]
MYTKEYVEEIDGINFPGKTFQDCVLAPIFDTQKNYYAKPFIKISKAHAVMLYEQKIITSDEANEILSGLNKIDSIDMGDRKYDPSYEDMFFMIEHELENLIGRDKAGRLHIARSRNDIDICEFRMVLREKVLEVIQALNTFRQVLLSLAKENITTVMPAYTHTQPAQPTTLAHYILAYQDSLERDFDRFVHLYNTINLSPLGAAAITTTGFPINRQRTAELLGFAGLVENSYDGIAGCDYLTECASALMIMNTSLSRFMKDTLDFCTKEFNVFYLSDPYVQVSSIMPQKRNPSSLEQTRPAVSKAIAEAKCVFDILHNTPFGDIVDTEEQLQPHLYDSVKYTVRAFKMLSSVFTTLQVNKEILFERAHEGFITATELADILVRDKGLSFRHSHKITSLIVKHLVKNGKKAKDITPQLIADISEEILGRAIDLEVAEIERALDPVNFVGIRTVTGGPAPVETERMLENRLKTLEKNQQLFKEYIEGLEASDKKLEAAANIRKAE